MLQKSLLFILCIILIGESLLAQKSVKVKKRDRKRDIEMVTSMGTIRMRLSDSTPLHRDNFIRLVKQHFYDSVKFHRVIQHFMVQAGEGRKNEKTYTVPAEFVPGLFHSKGALAAAREGDDINPSKASSGTQFYIVQGKKFSDAGLDSTETFRLKRKIPAAFREAYKQQGGTPHLDQNYTIFGHVINGLETVDAIAAVKTTGRMGNDVPVSPVYILSVKLVKRK